jgi:hypothetical protein
LSEKSAINPVYQPSTLPNIQVYRLSLVREICHKSKSTGYPPCPIFKSTGYPLSEKSAINPVYQPSTLPNIQVYRLSILPENTDPNTDVRPSVYRPSIQTPSSPLSLPAIHLVRKSAKIQVYRPSIQTPSSPLSLPAIRLIGNPSIGRLPAIHSITPKNSKLTPQSTGYPPCPKSAKIQVYRPSALSETKSIGRLPAIHSITPKNSSSPLSLPAIHLSETKSTAHPLEMIYNPPLSSPLKSDF